jgi:hypothetical protein
MAKQAKTPGIATIATPNYLEKIKTKQARWYRVNSAKS